MRGCNRNQPGNATVEVASIPVVRTGFHTRRKSRPFWRSSEEYDSVCAAIRFILSWIAFILIEGNAYWSKNPLDESGRGARQRRCRR